MSLIHKYYCEICGAEKSDVNNWFMAEITAVGVLLGGVVLLGAVGFGLWLAFHMGCLGLIAGPGIAWAVLFTIIRQTGTGLDEVTFDFTDVIGDILYPALLGLVGTAVIWVPPLIYLRERTGAGPIFTDQKFHNLGVPQMGPNVPMVDNGRLQDIPKLLAKMDEFVVDIAAFLVARYQDEVAELIASTVASWDPELTSRRVELAIGRDLQFIRINGTIVGGLAGTVIYLISKLVP